jgi:hypothetical protein
MSDFRAKLENWLVNTKSVESFLKVEHALEFLVGLIPAHRRKSIFEFIPGVNLLLLDDDLIQLVDVDACHEPVEMLRVDLEPFRGALKSGINNAFLL